MEHRREDENKEGASPERDLQAERREEDRRIRVLRRAVDYSLWIIRQTDITLPEAQKLAQGVREQALILFPGKESAFDMIYAPRFRRAIAERFRLQ